jgi:predicted transposase YdaD
LKGIQKMGLIYDEGLREGELKGLRKGELKGEQKTLAFIADKLLKQGASFQTVIETLEVNEEWLKNYKKWLNPEEVN